MKNMKRIGRQPLWMDLLILLFCIALSVAALLFIIARVWIAAIAVLAVMAIFIVFGLVMGVGSGIYYNDEYVKYKNTTYHWYEVKVTVMNDFKKRVTIYFGNKFLLADDCKEARKTGFWIVCTASRLAEIARYYPNRFVIVRSGESVESFYGKCAKLQKVYDEHNAEFYESGMESYSAGAYPSYTSGSGK